MRVIFILNISYWIFFIELGLILLCLFNILLIYRSIILVEWYLRLCSIIRLYYFPCFIYILNCPELSWAVSFSVFGFPYKEYFLYLLKICPRNFNVLFSRISINDLICPPGPSYNALKISLVLLYIYIFIRIIILYECGMWLHFFS